MAQLVKNLPAIRETWVWSWVGKIPWRREWLPTLVFWPGELHGLYSPWGHKELDTTEWLSLHHFTDTVEVKWFLDAYWKYCPCWLRGEKTWIRAGSTDGQVILKKKKTKKLFRMVVWIADFLWKLYSSLFLRLYPHQRKLIHSGASGLFLETRKWGKQSYKLLSNFILNGCSLWAVFWWP